MPKKEWTPEERKAFGEKMKRAKAQKAPESLPQEDEGVRPEKLGTQPEEHLNEDYSMLLREIAELKARLDSQPQALTPTQQPAVNPAGALVGTFEKYIVDPNHYPDPRERLAHETRLARFAFPINYELGWDVSKSVYENKQGVHVEEPRFTLELNYIIRDEDTDEPTNGRYTLRKAVFHEDPAAAMAVARENNLPVDKENQKAFLDEMRYLRMKNWLLEAFYPPKNDVKKQAKKEMVFGNRVVEYFEVSSVDGASVPFDQLKKKL